jgi:hypothetical protein
MSLGISATKHVRNVTDLLLEKELGMAYKQEMLANAHYV